MLTVNYFINRGFKESDFVRTVDFVDRSVQIALEIQSKSKTLKEFRTVLKTDAEISKKCAELKNQVVKFADSYPMPGFPHT